MVPLNHTVLLAHTDSLLSHTPPLLLTAMPPALTAMLLPLPMVMVLPQPLTATVLLSPTVSLLNLTVFRMVTVLAASSVAPEVSQASLLPLRLLDSLGTEVLRLPLKVHPSPPSVVCQLPRDSRPPRASPVSASSTTLKPVLMLSV